LLRTAARHADIVGLAGLGRTLPDGHYHEARMGQAEVHRQVRLVQDEARLAGRSPVLEALVHLVERTDDREARLRELTAEFAGNSLDDLAQAPYLLVGTYQEMAAQLRRQAAELGITSYVVREPAVAALEHVLRLLA
jgi:alkanesulfonate monooxygenase SsuD/methylene tetrahydromethanopterin reductase-like flavin-dependent oxidoreductase (luciferase family)